jgi:hypothetical protein
MALAATCELKRFPCVGGRMHKLSHISTSPPSKFHMPKCIVFVIIFSLLEIVECMN